jgi:hypothetical protein
MKEVLPSDYDLSEVHLVGNGPSASQFKYTTGTVICFHKPTVDECDIICTPIKRIGKEGYWNLPTIVGYILYLPRDKMIAKWLYLNKSLSIIENNHFCHKWATYQLCFSHKGCCLTDSGQRAYLWAMHNGAKKIHLWGFDNIWTTDDTYITSDPSAYDIFDNESNYISDKKYLDKRKLWKPILQPNTEIHK